MNQKLLYLNDTILKLTLLSADMLRFLSYVKVSMNACRRVQPIPQDFTFALAKNDLRSSFLLPHVKLPICSSVTQPPLQPPSPKEPSPPPLEKLLGSDLVEAGSHTGKRWIPPHFPTFPSKHTWMETPTFPERETEPLKIRELATQQGILAEKALRKLIAKRKSSGTEARQGVRLENNKSMSHRDKYEKTWEDTLQALAAEDEKARVHAHARTAEMEMEMDVDFDGEENTLAEGKNASAAVPGIRMFVNYDKKYWRKGSSVKASRS